MIRRLILVIVALVLGLSVASCGRKGNPAQPEGSDFPRRYPASSIDSGGIG